MSSFSATVWLTDPDCVPEAPNECCRTPGNVPVVPDHPNARPDIGVLVRVCRVCGRRHFEASLDPGDFRAEMRPVNG